MSPSTPYDIPLPLVSFLSTNILTIDFALTFVWPYISLGQETMTKSVGKPNIGGPFNLITQDGKPFSSDELLGKWSLIYFGFTNCPDVSLDEDALLVRQMRLILRLSV